MNPSSGNANDHLIFYSRSYDVYFQYYVIWQNSISIIDNLPTYGPHIYEGTNHSSDLLLSSTSSSLQSAVKDDGSRKQSFVTPNEYENESIFPLSYSDLTESKNNFAGSYSESIEPKKPMANMDTSFINKHSMPLFNSRENVASQMAIACTSSFEESNDGEISDIRDVTSNNIHLMSSNIDDITRHTLEKVRCKFANLQMKIECQENSG